MTGLTIRTEPTPCGADNGLRPVPWRRMAWVTWCQHRVALVGMTTLLGALAVYVWITGLELHHAYADAITCHPASSASCGYLVMQFVHGNSFLASGYPLQMVPALMGAFIGAPVLARELETGTFRFAWTQGFGPWRWALAKLVALAAIVAVTAGAMSALFSWYYAPSFATPLSGSEPVSLSPGLFDVRGVVLVGWALLAFALGCLAGMLTRRVVPAIAATLAAYGGLAIAVGGFLRQHYLAPTVTTKFNIPRSAWVLNQEWRTTEGHLVSSTTLGHLLQQGGAQLAGKGGVPDSLGSWEFLVRHGLSQWTTYQPDSRFWLFQSIEAGWLLASSVLLLTAAVVLVRRRSP